jgi:hypothetical protein
MEFPAYLALTLLCAGVLYWSVRNAKRKPGTPITGLFAYRVDDGSAEVATWPDGRPRDVPSGQWKGQR